MAKGSYDSTIARIAGNIASGIVSRADLVKNGQGEVGDPEMWTPLAVAAVACARAIVAEVERTEPSATPPPTETT